MTNLNEEQRKAQMDDMKSFDEQMPCVGIFWYDPEDHSFFGVRKKELIVLVGKWAEPIQDELTELLEKEFSLP